ncbi:uncharacterized protein BDZ99DRAFT_460459 [Mytilinidion resinicola]|uniref:DASH complex subunit DAD1 n=1 Tax=Mytilinidion resinicola TaxID=574789 RepID=A0A6A6YZ09_9PEZI|nr:uncharacterized protein BDZ99DRAFT_460459 [Mytilinidion resinicola]KAF2813165.1 hypothetical protein BDZ99DRAFT_460459 [Mytilinidion resinicola]
MSTSTNNRPAANAPTNGAGEKSYFEQQREMLMGEVAMSLDHVLHNINKLNRSLEEIIGCGWL